MTYLGQVEAADIVVNGEAIVYGFLCISCRKSTVLFQQT